MDYFQEAGLLFVLFKVLFMPKIYVCLELSFLRRTCVKKDIQMLFALFRLLFVPKGIENCDVSIILKVLHKERRRLV